MLNFAASIAEIRSGNHRVVIDLNVGHIRSFDTGGHSQPLHSAPWTHEHFALTQEIPAVDRYLSGDFFCLPFGANTSAVPPHGWTANSEWKVLSKNIEDNSSELRLQLVKTSSGAVVEKHLKITSRAPLIYQRHLINGGEGQFPLAHHTMTSMKQGGRIFFSPKLFAVTPENPIVEGRHLLRYPAQSHDLNRFPSVENNNIDLSFYPTKTGHEDFIILIDKPNESLAWTAIIRSYEKDIFFVLKDPRVLPTSMLWFSNGGRLDAPWNGRHTGVLGIEDGYPGSYVGARGLHMMRHANIEAYISLAPQETKCIKHIIGCVPCPENWQTITGISVRGNKLIIKEKEGKYLLLDIDPTFFEGEKNGKR